MNVKGEEEKRSMTQGKMTGPGEREGGELQEKPEKGTRSKGEGERGGEGGVS